MSNYQIVVVGGGSSGLMAAVQAANQGGEVLLIDKNPRLGRKLVLSGGGRCNVTNNTTRENLIKHIPGNGKFLYGALNQFDQRDIIEFFESRGTNLKEEDHGRMFPVTDRSRTILDTLVRDLDELGVTVRTKTVVNGLITEDGKIIGVRLDSGEIIHAKAVILAVGGCAYPRTGSTGDGYGWAQDVGHHVTRLYPTEASLLSNDPWCSNKEDGLSGVSLRDVIVTLWDDGKVGGRKLTEHHMDMIITHFGYSGPAILRTSGHVNQYLYRSGASEAVMTIDLVPSLSREKFNEETELMRERQLISVVRTWIPERMAHQVIRSLKLDPEMPFKQLLHADVDRLFEQLHAFQITAHSSQPIELGFVTGGGVDTTEVDPKTMESKIVDGLYFCGEFLDINGYTGGYNISAAFVTGAVAGRHAAWGSFS